MNAWVEAVAGLWPDAQVAPGRDPRAVRELAFLPNADRPQLLVPAGLPAASAAALRRYSHALGAVRRTARALAATAVRTGLADQALRDRLRIVGEGESVEDRLSELLGRRVVVSVGLGSARANRKPVLHVLTPDGEALAFVKVGDTDTVRELIAGEAAALERLARRSLRGIDVPRVIHHGEWRGLGLLVLSPLPTSALAFRHRRSAPVAAMRELTGQTRRMLLGESAFWARLRGVRLADPDRRDRFAEVVARADAAYAAEEIEFGTWHGDWTPWNMSWERDRVRLWDWERFDPDVPVGLDLLHYRLQSGRGYDYRSWPDGSLLRPLLPSGRTAAVTVELYLLELARRYLTACEGPLGESLRPQATALLDLLYANAGRTA